MIHHVVLWRLKPQAKRDGRIEALGQIEQAVEAMRGAVPGLLSVALGANQVDGADASDLMLRAEFVSWEALRAYEHHPRHEVLRGLIGPLRIERRAVDYEA